MGGMLDKPVTEKESECGHPSGKLSLGWASSCMQGWRGGMEDAHICLPTLPGPSRWKDVAMFGVMDGHGGEQVAKFCERHLPVEVCAHHLNGSLDHGDLKAALIGAFHKMDELLRDTAASGAELMELTNPVVPQSMGRLPVGNRPVDPDHVGCTACVCCITEGHFIVANAGDSRAVLCRGGRAVALSQDHKPNSEVERKRITDAGGYIEVQNCASGTQYRVCGNLNLSRALGDLEYKKDRSRPPEEQMICATPDVETFERRPDDEFLVICCDGVWDVKSNQEVVDFIRERLPRQEPVGHPAAMARILEDLLDRCVSPDLRVTKGLGGDNMTAVLVQMPTRGHSQAPQLLSVKLSTLTHSSQGVVTVKLALPGACTCEDYSLCMRERSAQLQVRAAQAGGASQTFSLKGHLPPGAQLEAPVAGQQAKFHAETKTLSVKLRWWRPTEL